MSLDFPPPRIARIALVILAAACTPGAPDGAGGAGASAASVPDTAEAAMPAAAADAPIRTDRTSYAVGGTELVVRATYVNRSADTVFIQPCGTSVPLWTLEAREGESWSRAVGPMCTMIAAPPLAVAPGAERTDTLRIAGPAGAEAVPRFEAGQVPGTFRLVYAIGAAREGEFGTRDPLPVEQRVSNEFRIER